MRDDESHAISPASALTTAEAMADPPRRPLTVAKGMPRGLAASSALLSAALELMSEGRGFGALSLREITARAGVVPATFYRHFANVDELGLALVEESGVMLRRLLRDVRRTGLLDRKRRDRLVELAPPGLHLR